MAQDKTRWRNKFIFYLQLQHKNANLFLNQGKRNATKRKLVVLTNTPFKTALEEAINKKEEKGKAIKTKNGNDKNTFKQKKPKQKINIKDSFSNSSVVLNGLTNCVRELKKKTLLRCSVCVSQFLSFLWKGSFYTQYVATMIHLLFLYSPMIYFVIANEWSQKHRRYLLVIVHSWNWIHYLINILHFLRGEGKKSSSNSNSWWNLFYY